MSPPDDAVVSGVVLAPLRVEAGCVRWGLPGGHVVRAGLRGRRHAAVRAALRARPGTTPVAVVGVAGALAPDARPGDLVVATEVRSGRATRRCPSAPAMAAELRAVGCTVHLGPIVQTDRPVWRVGDSGRSWGDAVAVDMESARLLDLLGPRPHVVVRAVVDTPARPLFSVATVPGGIAALASLCRVGTAVRRWFAAIPAATTPPAGEAGNEEVTDGTTGNGTADNDTTGNDTTGNDTAGATRPTTTPPVNAGAGEEVRHR